jgi:hypothetical protein
MANRLLARPKHINRPCAMVSAVVLNRLSGRVGPREENIIYRHDLDIRNATGWHGVTAAAMEDCGAGRATVAMPYKVVHGASDVAVGQRGYS